MRSLNELPIGERIALSFIIVLVCLLALALIGYLTGGWDKADAQPITCIAPEMRDKVRSAMLVAIEDGLKTRVQHLWESWMLDDRDQPQRSAVGMRRAIRAYVKTHEFIEKWNPPPC